MNNMWDHAMSDVKYKLASLDNLKDPKYMGTMSFGHSVQPTPPAPPAMAEVTPDGQVTIRWDMVELEASDVRHTNASVALVILEARRQGFQAAREEARIGRAEAMGIEVLELNMEPEAASSQPVPSLHHEKVEPFGFALDEDGNTFMKQP